LPASPTTGSLAADDDGRDGGDDSVRLTSVNTTLKPASTGDMEFLSYKNAQHAEHENQASAQCTPSSHLIVV